MEILYMLFMFILGSCLASFYTVIGIRLPKHEDFINSRSHCDNCGKKLKWYELIPLLSYCIQLGKCRNCGQKIKLRYFLYELICGILFAVSYKLFGFSYDLLTCILLISMITIIIVSDTLYMIISDEILIVFGIIFLISNLIQYGFIRFGLSIFSGLLAFIIMYVLKLLGDALFKKESLGGGDIKLMGVLGIILNYQAIICTIFLSSFIALPYALYITISKKDGVIPFGPFLGISAVILFMLGLSQVDVLDLIYNLI